MIYVQIENIELRDIDADFYKYREETNITNDIFLKFSEDEFKSYVILARKQLVVTFNYQLNIQDEVLILDNYEI